MEDSRQGEANTPEQVPGQSTLEVQLADLQAEQIEKQLEHANANSGSLGTSSIGNLIDAASGFAAHGDPDRLEMIRRPDTPVPAPDRLTFESITAALNKHAADLMTFGLAVRLQELGYLNGTNQLGQQYYPRKAIAAFQGDAGLQADGRYSRQTHDALWTDTADL